MNIKTALKKIVEALGGTPTAKNIPGLINEVSENVGGGSGSSGSLAINMILDSQDSESGVLDKTWAEINAAVEAKIPCFVYMELSEGTYVDIVNSVCADTLLYLVSTSSNTFFASSADGYPGTSMPDPSSNPGQEGIK